MAATWKKDEFQATRLFELSVRLPASAPPEPAIAILPSASTISSRLLALTVSVSVDPACWSKRSPVTRARPEVVMVVEA